MFGGVLLIGASTLLFEVALTRVLSFKIWHHFAYVVISTALLGYGAAGSIFAVSSRLRAAEPRRILGRASLASALTAGVTVVLVAVLPLEPLQIFDEPTQAILFVAYALMAAVPFFFSGLALSAAFSTAARKSDRIYFWDLVGAGAGCALSVLLMNALTPPGAVLVSAAGFAAASCVFSAERRLRTAGASVAVTLLLASTFADRIPYTPSESKSLIFKLRYWAPIATRWTALFRTEILEDRGRGPPLSADDEWGLSRRAARPVQLPRYVINHDGSAGTPLFDLRQGQLDFLDQHVLRFPYLIANAHPRVLVIGVGAGRDVVTARRFGAAHVVGVELDESTIHVVQDEMNSALNGLFRQPSVTLVNAEGRHFVKTTRDRFDLIQLTGVDTLAAAFSGAYVLAENYLYTVEAFHDYLDRLKPGGILSFATGDFEPQNPKAAGRMLSVARQALAERGIARPGDHIVIIDSGRLLCEIMIRESGFSEQDRALLRAMAAYLDFLPRWLPGTIGPRPYPELATLEGPPRERLLARLRYDVSATTDDRPFFFAYYRWADLLSGGMVGPDHTTAMGQIVLALLAVVLMALSALFILGPLWLKGKPSAFSHHMASAMIPYFVGIGLGFMLFEISLMQRFVLFLGHPTYSLSVTLASLLISLGIGSFQSRRFIGRETLALPAGVLLLALLAAFYTLGLPGLQAALLERSLAVRILASVFLLSPVGLVAGLFFPLGVLAVEQVDARLVPWAWGINCCASVTGTVLAVLLAMIYGFQFVWLVAVVIYATGTAAFVRFLSRGRGPVAAPR